MFVNVNGARLFVDVAGPHLDLSGDVEAERVPLIVLHGGPGYDHTALRGFFDRFADRHLVVYLDHRGNGRSTGGNARDRALWTLDQWGDDLAGLIDSLGLDRPIVFGQSFGGMVAQSHATRHPGQARAYVFSSTAARMRLDEVLDGFEALGGPGARAAAEPFWRGGDDAAVAEFMRVCVPLYNRQPRDAMGGRHTRYRFELGRHFFGDPGEMWRMDFRPKLGAVGVPAMVLTGDTDPVTPPERSREIHAALPAGADYVEVTGAGHGAFRDKPDETEAILRAFFARV